MAAKLFWMGILVLAVADLAGAQTLPATPGDGASLEVCLAAAADYSPVYPTRVFPAGATNEVAAVLRLRSGESYPAMTATWVAVDVPGTPPGFVIRTIDMDVRGRDRAVVRVNHPEGLLPGRYRLDITAGTKPWKSAEFAVAPIAAAEVKHPRELLPLTPGTVWRYTFTQEFGRNIRPNLPPGMKLDADGKLRATLTKRATKTDNVGTQIETRRNNVLVEEEWWQLTDAGLVIAKIKSDGDESTFSPPQSLWPWPLKTPKEWFFEPEDKSFKQHWRLWGPVRIRGPAGAAPGYVVLMEQPSPQIDLSAERHYLPGIGMVREVITQARNGVMLTRWEIVLTTKP